MGMSDGEQLKMNDVDFIEENPMNNESLEFTKEGLMSSPEYGPVGRHPNSRDWELESLLVECARNSCVANVMKNCKGFCAMPSLIKINRLGKCKGYQRLSKS